MHHPHEMPYTIPAQYRKMENMHIVFWLVKDISWCLLWRPIGLAMIVPTVAIALTIAYRTRKMKSEMAHNFAIFFWIIANAYWMISEFFHFDENIVYGLVTFKHLAIAPFSVGLFFLFYYYVFQKPKETDPLQVATL